LTISVPANGVGKRAAINALRKRFNSNPRNVISPNNYIITG